MYKIIIKPIESEYNHFLALLRNSLSSSSNPLLSDILLKICDNQGKMMRPILVLLFSKLFGEITNSSYHSALCLELLHNASLLHDDVVDESSLRRGLPSINSLFGNKLAVLVGDYLLSSALFHAQETNIPKITSSIINLGRILSEGEILQLNNRSCSNFDYSSYFEIVDKKTASLFSVCCLSGVLSTSNFSQNLKIAEDFGILLGRSFQIIDDILDYSDSEVTGKPSGHDMIEGKLTLPVLYALNSNGNDKYFDLALRVRKGVADNEEIMSLINFARVSGGLNYAKNIAMSFKDEAVSILRSLSNSNVVESLISLFDLVINRVF